MTNISVNKRFVLCLLLGYCFACVIIFIYYRVINNFPLPEHFFLHMLLNALFGGIVLFILAFTIFIVGDADLLSTVVLIVLGLIPTWILVRSVYVFIRYRKVHPIMITIGFTLWCIVGEITVLLLFGDWGLV